VPSKHVISITQFVDAAEIDPIFYEKAYYLDPDDAGKKPYALLLRAMEEKGLVALGKLALRQKEHLVAIRPQDGHLTAEMLLYPDEVRPFEGNDISDVDVSKSELEMAFALIDMLHEPFDPQQYTDEYRDTLLNMITTKLEGGEVVATEEVAPPAQTVDLMAALRASVEAAKARSTGDEPASDAPAEEPAAEEARASKRRSRKKADDGDESDSASKTTKSSGTRTRRKARAAAE
jgi:DNA end-binding protein Ku